MKYKLFLLLLIFAVAGAMNASAADTYTAGTILVAPPDGDDKDPVPWPEAGVDTFEYDLQHDTTGMFNMIYTPHAGGSGTNRTVLVVTWPEYGTKRTSAPSAGANHITTISFPDSHTAILALEDYTTEQCTFGFTIATTNLTNAQAARWMDGEDMTTGYTATEYQLNEGYTLMSSTTLAELQANATAYATFTQNAIPKTYATTSIRVTKAKEINSSYTDHMHTFHARVSSVPEVTNAHFNAVGQYNTGSLNYLDSTNGRWINGHLRWDIPMVHNSENTLVEVTSIRIYVPDARLKIKALIKSDAGNPGILNDLGNNNFSQIWNEWRLGARTEDETGIYYDVTPPAGTRWFNTGVSGSLTSRYYGMKLAFALVSTDDPLEPATTYNAPDTVITYKVAGDSETHTYVQPGPEISTFTQTFTKPSTAYNPNRYKSNKTAPLNDVTIGSFRQNETFTYFTNSYRRLEQIPEIAGPFTMHYEFPYSIQPSKLRLTPGKGWLASASGNYYALSREADLAAINYTTQDGTTYSVPAETVEAFNTWMLTAGQDSVYSFELSEVSEDNRVVTLDIVWNKLCKYWDNSNESYLPTNTTSNSDMILNYGDRRLIAAQFSYSVPEDCREKDASISNNKVQVKYDLQYNGESHTNDNYLWYRLVDQECPRLISNYEDTDNNTSNPKWLDDQEITIGSISLYVGQYGERRDEVKNPVINLRMALHGATNLNSINTNTNMPLEDTLAFFTGKFTAMPKLSGWVCEYTTLKHLEGLSWTIPEITDAAGQTVQIPLEDGDYLKTLLIRYYGTVSFPHDSPEDTRTSYTLMKNICIRRLPEDPFTGQKILVNSTYGTTYAIMYAYFHMDGCTCSDHIHDPDKTGQFVNSKTGTPVKDNKAYPMQYLFVYRQDSLSYDGITRRSITAANISQGGTFTLSFLPQLRFPCNSPFHYNYIHRPNTSESHYYSGDFYPFDVHYAAYVELTDPDFTVNLAQTQFMGVAANDNRVVTEEITVTDSSGTEHRFLKMEFADGIIQPYCYGTYGGKHIYDPSLTQYPGFFKINLGTHTDERNVCNTMQISLTALPGASIGEHYPIGRVYYDYSELLEQYDAPNVTGPSLPETYNSKNDYNMTNYTFSGAVPDEYGLSHTTTTETDKLFMTDFSQGSATAQKVIVSIAAVTGADAFPGRGNIYNLNDRVTDFTELDTEDLNGLVSVRGSSNNIITDYVTCVKLPRTGKSVDYTDASGNPATATSDITLELRGPITRVNKNGVTDADFSIVYTTDEDPTAASTYVPAASVIDWSAVTGFKVTANKIELDGAITLYLDLRTGKKESLDVLHGYMGGSYTYDLQGMDGEGLMGLSTWNYNNIPVTGSTGGIIFWDTYNENGTKSTGTDNAGKCETGIGGISVSLYDKDDNLIMSTTTSTASATLGKFSLESWKSDAGQYIVIGEPVVDGVTVKLTKNSMADFYRNQYDSDFDRNVAGTTHTLVLPELPDTGYSNIGAGFVKLPKIEAADISVIVGKTKDLSAVMTYCLGMALPSTSYNLTFEIADTTLATADPVTKVLTTSTNYSNSNARTITGNTVITGVAGGDTTMRICTITAAGDTVEKIVNIHILSTGPMTIKKSGMKAGDSAIFTVTRKGESAPLYTVPLTAGSDGKAEITLKDVPVEEYTVAETSWSWAYEKLDPKTQDISKNSTFTFVNKPKGTTPVHAEAEVNNKLEKKSN